MKRVIGHASEHGTSPVVLRMACGPQFVLRTASHQGSQADGDCESPTAALAAYGSEEGSAWFERMIGEDFAEFSTTTTQ